MSLTRVSAEERDERRDAIRTRRFGMDDVLLGVASVVVAAAIALAYAGRIRMPVSLTPEVRGPALLNLNTAGTADDLDRPLRALHANLHDRQFAVRELFRYVSVEPDGRRVLPNVGSIGRIDVPVEAIDGDSRLVEYAGRLRDARERAAKSGRVGPVTLPLFTAADLATLKPLFAVRGLSEFRRTVLLSAVVYIAGFHVVSLLWRRFGIAGDRILLAAAHLLTGIAFALLVSRADPLRDTLLFVRFTEGVVVGLVLLAAASAIDFRTKVFGEFSYVPLAAAIGLCAMLILFGTGPAGSGAKVNLGPIQPIEAIRLLLALFLAGYFASRWEVLRDIRSGTLRGRRIPPWLNVPRLEYVLPVMAGVALALGFFFLQKDLGPALFLCFVFLAMYAVARGRAVLAVAGLAVLLAGFYVGYQLGVSSTLADRVRIWQDPWDNVVRGGDQVAQAHWALAAGAVPGTGLGLGDTRYVPAGHTDLALAAVGEELGAIGLLLVAVLYGLVVWRGFRIARAAPSDYAFFLALAITLTLILPVLVMGAGMIGAIPLTGVVTPFLSYGGSAMAANLAGIGLLSAIRSGRRAAADTAPFRLPLRSLGAVFAACAAVLIVVLVKVQVVRADEYLVKPQLTLQADGGRRFQYNPRILDVVRQIPRGTIYDRQGLPLATDRPALVDKWSGRYRQFGVDVEEACPDRTERCYPLGGVAFHLVGDARTRMNWSATNTSYVERDLEDRLRGFNDRPAAIRTTDGAGNGITAIRRDYRDVVDLVRHRHQPNHGTVKAFLARSRDVRLTIDARLQARLGAILKTYAKASSRGSAAAVVIDADTGEVLATASHPWPELDDLDDRRTGFMTHAGAGFSRPKQGNARGSPHDNAEAIERALLDRARYGLYPPGSTFKMVTAAAALDRGRDAGGLRFTCRRLPDGRVGAELGGLGRPIRDDVLDTRPHGTLGMHDALVVSCNAYFAQLALAVGADRLERTSRRAGIPAAIPDGAVNVAHAGYGQGSVLATPLRMARIAAAVATDGVLRGPALEAVPDESPNGDRFVSAGAAQFIAQSLRDAVLRGTGRYLRAHDQRIAGKTGTAQVANAPSHAWFVGFAPSGPATRRIAFAVIIENAGYGGSSAAAAAGEIVTAAAGSGLVRK